MKENNTLIAEFMQEGSEGFNLYDYNGCHYKVDELMFHTSWDWLMPVIEKILDNAFYDVATSMEDFYSIKRHIPYMDETYQAVVDFIKTYNDE